LSKLGVILLVCCAAFILAGLYPHCETTACHDASDAASMACFLTCASLQVAIGGVTAPHMFFLAVVLLATVPYPILTYRPQTPDKPPELPS